MPISSVQGDSFLRTLLRRWVVRTDGVFFFFLVILGGVMTALANALSTSARVATANGCCASRLHTSAKRCLSLWLIPMAIPLSCSGAESESTRFHCEAVISSEI